MKFSLKWGLLVGIITGIVFFSANTLFTTERIQPQTSNSVIPAVQENKTSPLRLKIPRINTDAAVEYVGMTPDGAMGAPESPTDVAWFRAGIRPGEIGSAVIDGHFGWKNGLPAVFDNLSKLRIGDLLYVEDQNGTVTTFVVRKLQIYGQHDNASEIFTSNDGEAHLNLITCEGTWNAGQKSYSNRLVVFTDKKQVRTSSTQRSRN